MSKLGLHIISKHEEHFIYFTSFIGINHKAVMVSPAGLKKNYPTETRSQTFQLEPRDTKSMANMAAVRIRPIVNFIVNVRNSLKLGCA